jgi:hypothetical protein
VLERSVDESAAPAESAGTGAAQTHPAKAAFVNLTNGKLNELHRKMSQLAKFGLCDGGNPLLSGAAPLPGSLEEECVESLGT